MNPATLSSFADQNIIMPLEDTLNQLPVIKDLMRLSEIPDTCANLFQEYLDKIVMGSLPVDAWDDYVKEFYSMGGQTIEEEVNAAYQEQQAK